jgi:hypothetical protein
LLLYMVVVVEVEELEAMVPQAQPVLEVAD